MIFDQPEYRLFSRALVIPNVIGSVPVMVMVRHKFISSHGQTYFSTCLVGRLS